MKDLDIISLYKDGRHEQAFKIIVDRYSEKLYWLIRRYVYSHEDANDLLQDIFTKIWTAFPSFRGDSQFFTWLYRIATNEVLNFLRKQRVRAMLSLESVTSILEKKADDDVFFDGTELQRELHKAMIKLPEKQRLVFGLRYFEELKYEDISKITGTSVGALKASYHHAYSKILKELESRF